MAVSAIVKVWLSVAKAVIMNSLLFSEIQFGYQQQTRYWRDFGHKKSTDDACG